MNVRVRLLAVALLGVVVSLVPGCGSDEQSPGPVGPPTIQRPGAPTDVVAEPGDQQATVSWRAPADNGGRAISRYDVKVFSNGAEVPAEVAPASSLSAVVTGLTNGTAYTFTVTATNSQGTSVESIASAPVIPRVVPGAPQNLSVTPGDKQVVVNWEAADGKGMPITGYVATLRAGDTEQTQTVTGTSATFTELTNGTAYTITVAADNGHVRGTPASAESTPFTRPGAPQVSTIPFISQVTVTWTVESTGGSPILGYTVTVFEGETVIRTLETTGTRLVVDELTNGTTYHFTVVATNAAGDGPASERVAGRPVRAPSEPLNFRCTPGDGQVSFTWEPPVEDYGDPVVGYRIEALIEGNATMWQMTELHYTITGLTNGVAYRFHMAAKNSAGYGDGARPVTCTPQAP